MPARSFVHLHCHSHYSLLDGANRIPELVAHVKASGMNAVAHLPEDRKLQCVLCGRVEQAAPGIG